MSTQKSNKKFKDTQTYNKTDTQTLKNFFYQLVPSVLPLLKKHKGLGWWYCQHIVWFVVTRLGERFWFIVTRLSERFWFIVTRLRGVLFFFFFFGGVGGGGGGLEQWPKYYKSGMAYNSAIYYQATHTIYQLPPPTCSIRAIQKKHI